MEDLNKQQIIETVERYIVGRRPGGATLEIIKQGVRQDQDWWYVPIRTSIQPAKRYEYYETLADVEKELEKLEHLTVLFVPTVPEVEQLAA